MGYISYIETRRKKSLFKITKFNCSTGYTKKNKVNMRTCFNIKLSYWRVCRYILPNRSDLLDYIIEVWWHPTFNKFIIFFWHWNGAHFPKSAKKHANFPQKKDWGPFRKNNAFGSEHWKGSLVTWCLQLRIKQKIQVNLYLKVCNNYCNDNICKIPINSPWICSW